MTPMHSLNAYALSAHGIFIPCSPKRFWAQTMRSVAASFLDPLR